MKQTWNNVGKGVACIFLILLPLALISYVVETNNKDFKKELLQLRSHFDNRLKRSLRIGVKTQEEDNPRKKRSPSSAQTAEPADRVSGVIYYRWGRRDCSGPNNHLIYHGVVAGSYFSHTGGSSNFLCLHSNVSYVSGQFVDGSQGASYIYGAEYRDSSWINNIFNLTLTEGQNLQYHSVPCAICFASSRNTQVMIPGRNDCPQAWTKEYSGFIMTGGHGDKHSSESICVDDTPQVVPGTNGNQNGAYLFVSEAICTSLPCEPVIQYREIRCVVCSI